MTRYISLPRINKSTTGKRFYSTVMPRIPQMSQFPLEYTAQIGDRWDTLSYKFYGSASMWHKLAISNNGANGSIFIKPGTVIKIPEL